MWDDVGILRDAAGPAARARPRSTNSTRSCAHRRGRRRPRFNLSWHDWLNLKNLMLTVSRVIATAALAREDSRGAHFREDFPTAGDLQSSSFTVVASDARRAGACAASRCISRACGPEREARVTRPHRGADALVAALGAAGVTRVFALSGNHVMPVFDALFDSGIALVHTRHEAAAVHMADAWARLTGEVGVALVTGGPGPRQCRLGAVHRADGRGAGGAAVRPRAATASSAGRVPGDAPGRDGGSR
jgi:hypothetical protein